MSSYAAITRRCSPRRKLVGILSESIGLGGFPHHLVCVFPLICLFYSLSIHDLSCFSMSCSFGSFVVELCVEGEDFKDLRY